MALSSSGNSCNYAVNNYSLSANAQLIYWYMGTPVNCGPAWYNTSYGQPSASGGYYSYDCGAGTYSVTSVHSAWILGYNAGAVLSSGYQYFS